MWMRAKHLQLLYRCISTKPSISTKSSLPGFYDINVSLYSNISKISSIDHLLELHDKLPNQFNPKHLSFASRQLIKHIARHQKKVNARTAFIPESRLDSWEKLLTGIYSVDIAYLSSEEIIDLVHFSYKITYFQIPIGRLFPKLTQSSNVFKEKLMEAISNPNFLELLNFPQLSSILYSLVHLSPTHTVKFLEYLRKPLAQNPFCTCFHLILLSKGLNLIISRKILKQDSTLILDLRSLISQNLMQQMEILAPFMAHQIFMHIHSAVVPINPSASTKILEILLPKLKEVKEDDNIFQPYFKADLNLFIQSLKQYFKNTNSKTSRQKSKLLAENDVQAVRTAQKIDIALNA